MDDWQLRLLDPIADADLYREAYDWRPSKSADRMSFETFASDNPTHLVFGLFSPDLQAVYMFCEMAPRCFDAHFTSRRDVSRETILNGAKESLSLMLTHGAEEVSAVIVKRNRALRQFVTEIGMKRVSFSLFTCVEDVRQCNFFPPRNQRKVYVKYVKVKEPPLGPFRQEAAEYANSIGTV